MVNMGRHWELLVYIFNSTLYLSQNDMGLFLFFMTVNTPFFLILITKAVTKGIAKIFKSNEYAFRYLAVILLGLIYFSTVIDEKILSIYRDHFNLQLFGLLFEGYDTNRVTAQHLTVASQRLSSRTT